MTIWYDDLHTAFLEKVVDYGFLDLCDNGRVEAVDGYMKRAAAAFKKNCKYDLTLCDDNARSFSADFKEEDVDELIDIISDGMVLQWLKPYLYQQENLQNVLNTADYSMYSPAELLLRIGNTYDRLKREYIQEIREYSYNHGDLTGLHL